MAEDLMQSAGPVPGTHALGGWRAVIFAPVGDGQAPARKRRGTARQRHPRPAVLRPHHPLRLPHRPGYRPGRPSATAEHHLAGDRGVRRGRLRRHRHSAGPGPGRAPLGDRARHRAECRRHGRGERDPHPGPRQQRRAPERNRDQRLLHAFPGAPDRPVHGRHHGGPALSGPGLAAAHRDLHRPGRDGLRGRRSRAAPQRPGQPGHRLGRDRAHPPRLRLTARTAVDRGCARAAR